MEKLFLKKLNEKKKSKNVTLTLEEIKSFLSNQHACYVLVTCSKPSEEGKMNVELNYDGDESLASYLIQGAQGIFDENLEQSIDSYQK